MNKQKRRFRVGRFFKRAGIIIAIILVLLYIVVEARQNRKFDAPYPAIKAVKDSLVIERGRQLVFGAAHCADCHSHESLDEQLNKGLQVPISGGRVFDLPIGKLYSPNLTPDETGIGNMSDETIARALRYGVRHDGTALFDLMPFHNTSDEDLVAIISYLRSQPAVKNEVPKNKMSFLGKVVKAFLLKPVGPSGEVPLSVKRDTTVIYGQYLAGSVANCRGCHTNRDLMTGAFIGEEYAGGLKFDMKTDSGTYSLTTPNLTPDATGRITEWSQEQFIQRFRMGKTIPQSHMPWGPFSRMSDDDLKAIYKFLKTVKPVHNEIKPGLVKEN